MRFSSIIVLLFFACIASTAPLYTTPHNNGLSSRSVFDTFKNKLGFGGVQASQKLPMCSDAIREAVPKRLHVIARKAGLFTVFESRYNGEEVDIKAIPETDKYTLAEAKKWAKAGYLLVTAISGHGVAYLIMKHMVPHLAPGLMKKLMKEAMRHAMGTKNDGKEYLEKKNPENFLWRFNGKSWSAILINWVGGWIQKALVHVMTGQPCQL